MSLADYLAKNYLSSEKKAKSKEKQPKTSSKGQTVIIDQNLSLSSKRSKPEAPKPNPVSVPAVKKSSGWKVVGTDEVIQESPVINRSSDNDNDNDSQQRMASGAKAGLQTGAQVAQQIREKEQRELEYLKKQSKEALGGNNQTIHRDATGQRINIDEVRERKRSLAEQQKLEEERRLKDLNMGLIQKLELEESRKRLRSAENSSLSQHADAVELNNNLRRKEFEDDPMLSFKPSKSQKYVSRTGRKLFTSGFPENRFGIVPGYRWDGVDRSNGFERAYFKKQVERERVKTLSYTMQEDL